MIAASGPWTLGALVAFVLIGATIAAGAFGVWFYRRQLAAELEKQERASWAGDPGTVRFAGALGAAVWLVLAFCLATGMWPYSSEYHQLRHVSGTVEEVSSRIVPQGSGMAQRFVVVVGGHPFGVDDTRAALIEPGDHINLMCTREWQYQADSGWGCVWGAAQ